MIFVFKIFCLVIQDLINKGWQKAIKNIEITKLKKLINSKRKVIVIIFLN